MAEEKRRFSRVCFPIAVRLDGAGMQRTGRVKNLGVKGVFVETGGGMLLGTLVQVLLELDGGSPPECLCLQGKIVRVDPEGVAVDFQEMSLETFAHLKNIVMYNNNGEIRENDS